MLRNGQESANDPSLLRLEIDKEKIMKELSSLTQKEEGELSDEESPQSPDIANEVDFEAYRNTSLQFRSATPEVPFSRRNSLESVANLAKFTRHGDLDLRLCVPRAQTSSRMQPPHPKQSTVTLKQSTSNENTLPLRNATTKQPRASDFFEESSSSLNGVTGDNYDSVDMEIEVESETSKSPTDTSALPAEDDEADALRKMLLSQVTKKQSTVKKTTSISRKSLSKGRKETPDRTDGNGIAAVLGPVSSRTAEVQTEEHSTIESTLSDSLRNKEEFIGKALREERTRAKEVSALRKDLKLHQEKKEAIQRRRKRLIESLHCCDLRLSREEEVIVKLQHSLLKLNKDGISAHEANLTEMQEHIGHMKEAISQSKQPRRAKKRKSSSAERSTTSSRIKPPSKKSSRSATTNIDNESRSSQNAALERRQSTYENRSITSSPVAASGSKESVEGSQGRRTSWVAEQLDLNEIIQTENRMTEEAEAEMFQRLMSRSQNRSGHGEAQKEVLPAETNVPTSASLEVSPLVVHNETGGHSQPTADDELAVSPKDLNNPLLLFRSYRFCPTFPWHLLKHPGIAQNIDPLVPLCPFQLHGRCADERCPWQHEKDYHLSEMDIVQEYLQRFPALCPSEMAPDDYARKLLESAPLEAVVQKLVSEIPSSALKCCSAPSVQHEVPKTPPLQEVPVEYEIAKSIRTYVR
jgi:hypothetical protein